MCENLRNAPVDCAREILAVSFGTSYQATRQETIGAIESAMERAFPSYAVRRAFTSGMVLKSIEKKQGLKIDSVTDALDRAVAGGVKELIVQPTHLMRGKEYDKLMDLLTPYQGAFQKLKVGAPLLHAPEDFQALSLAVTERVEREIKTIRREEDDCTGKPKAVAGIFMGHGTDAPSNAVYERIGQTMAGAGQAHYFVATVEGTPRLSHILPRVMSAGYRQAVLMPLMVVAGDHACNDLAGDREDSWVSQLRAAGIESHVILEGLGALPRVQQMYVAHIQRAILE